MNAVYVVSPVKIQGVHCKKLVHKVFITVYSCTLCNSIHVSHFCNLCSVIPTCKCVLSNPDVTQSPFINMPRHLMLQMWRHRSSIHKHITTLLS